jgi:hypothetical protein
MTTLGYLTTHALSADTAAALAAMHGLDLEIVEPRDLLRLRRERAELIVDWDSMPDDYRAELLSGTEVKIVAIHGYNLDEDIADCLPCSGIIRSRRLDHLLFRAVAGESRHPSGLPRRSSAG